MLLFFLSLTRRRPPRSTRTDSLFPSTAHFRSELSQARDCVAYTSRITYITDDVNALRQEVARQQAAVRGLLLSGNRDYIGKYETAKAEYERRQIGRAHV